MQFFVSSSSGIAEMANEKKLLIDFIHFDGIGLYNLDTIPIILPKNKKFDTGKI